MTRCPNCQTLLDVPSEVERGTVIGICSQCRTPFGPAAEKNRPHPDPRGRPSKPGGGKKIIWEAA